MFKPPSEWTEDDILALPAEGVSLEKKGAVLLDLTVKGASEDKTRTEMAIQLSAFANSEGGTLVYGVSDDGNIDHGGVSRQVKGRQSTKDWIEDVIGPLTEPRISGVRVFEIPSNGSTSSRIFDNKAIFLIQIPASINAPHQCKHNKMYYIRDGSHSRPASHEEIKQIIERTSLPILIPTFEIAGMNLPVQREGRVAGDAIITYQITMVNEGRVATRTAALQMEINNLRASFADWEQSLVVPHSTSNSPKTVWELTHPVYPQMKYSFWIKMTIPLKLAPHVTEWWTGVWGDPIDDCVITWFLFADNAPPRSGELSLTRHLNFYGKARKEIDNHPDSEAIYRYYQPGCLP